MTIKEMLEKTCIWIESVELSYQIMWNRQKIARILVWLAKTRDRKRIGVGDARGKAPNMCSVTFFPK